MPARRGVRYCAVLYFLAATRSSVVSVDAAAAGAPTLADAKPPALALLLFGPYSNLAHKYLWQSLLELWDAVAPARLVVVAAGRDERARGGARVRAAVERNTTCGAGPAAAACAALRTALLADVTYVCVREEGGYAEVGGVLAAAARTHDVLGVVAFFSTDAGVVPGVLQALRMRGGVSFLGAAAFRGPVEPAGFSRAIVEKPLGGDAASSARLAAALRAQAPAPGAVLVMDHYLGKTALAMTVAARAAFFAAGGAWAALASGLDDGGWAEARAVEAETAAGRTGFYNGVGAVRDMLQSHVTLFIAAAIGPANDTWGPAFRAAALARLRVGRGPTALRPARYAGYAEHVDADRAPGGRGAFDVDVRRARRCLAARAARARGGAAAAAADAGDAACAGAPTLDAAGPHELYGRSFRGVTGVAARLDVAPPPAVAGAGAPRDATLDVRVAKAVGERAAGVLVVPRQPLGGTGCGPVTVTFHMHGRVRLPPGAPAAAAAPHVDAMLPHDAPGVVVTGACPQRGGRSRGLDPALLAPLLPRDWSVSHDADAGVWVAAPRVEDWRPSARGAAAAEAVAAAVAAGEGDGAAAATGAERLAAAVARSAASSAAVAAVDAASGSVVAAGDAGAGAGAGAGSGAGAAGDAGAAVLARLAARATAPGRGGGDAYTRMLAAALSGGGADAFASPEEAVESWRLWGSPAGLADAAAAGRLLRHAAALHAAGGDDGDDEAPAFEEDPSADDYGGGASGGDGGAGVAAVSPAAALGANAPPTEAAGASELGGPAARAFLAARYGAVFERVGLPALVAHAPGDGAWLRALRPGAPFARGGGNESAATAVTAAGAAKARGAGARLSVVVRGRDGAGFGIDKFAGDLVSAAWAGADARADGRAPRVALGAGPFAPRVGPRRAALVGASIKRAMEPDARALAPFPPVAPPPPAGAAPEPYDVYVLPCVRGKDESAAPPAPGGPPGAPTAADARADVAAAREVLVLLERPYEAGDEGPPRDADGGEEEDEEDEEDDEGLRVALVPPPEGEAPVPGAAALARRVAACVGRRRTGLVRAYVI